MTLEVGRAEGVEGAKGSSVVAAIFGRAIHPISMSQSGLAAIVERESEYTSRLGVEAG